MDAYVCLVDAAFEQNATGGHSFKARLLAWNASDSDLMFEGSAVLGIFSMSARENLNCLACQVWYPSHQELSRLTAVLSTSQSHITSTVPCCSLHYEASVHKLA